MPSCQRIPPWKSTRNVVYGSLFHFRKIFPTFLIFIYHSGLAFFSDEISEIWKDSREISEDVDEIQYFFSLVEMGVIKAKQTF